MSGRRLGLAAFTALCALSGCDSLRGANPDNPIWQHRPAGSLSVLYSTSLVIPARHDGEAYEVGQPEIDVAGRRVFVGSSDHGLYAVTATSGEVLWRFETLSYVQCAPLYDALEDVIYFGSNDGALYKVKARDGELVWRFATNSEVAKRPVLDSGVLYATNANDTVLALRPGDGELLWTQHRAPAQGMEIASHSGPTVWRGKVYVGFSDGTVTAFDQRTGEERWQPVDLSAEAEQTLGDVPQFLDVDTTPVPDVIAQGPVVYVGSYAGGVHALDAESGTELWSNPAVEGVSKLTLWTQPEHAPRAAKDEEPVGPPIPARKLLIATTGISGIWGLEPETGRELWHRPLPNGGVTAPVPVDGALLVASSKLGLFLVSPLDGGIIDGIHTGEGIAMAPAAHGHRAFVMTNGGRFLGLYVEPPR